MVDIQSFSIVSRQVPALALRPHLHAEDKKWVALIPAGLILFTVRNTCSQRCLCNCGDVVIAPSKKKSDQFFKYWLRNRSIFKWETDVLHRTWYQLRLDKNCYSCKPAAWIHWKFEAFYACRAPPNYSSYSLPRTHSPSNFSNKLLFSPLHYLLIFVVVGMGREMVVKCVWKKSCVDSCWQLLSQRACKPFLLRERYMPTVEVTCCLSARRGTVLCNVSVLQINPSCHRLPILHAPSRFQEWNDAYPHTLPIWAYCFHITCYLIHLHRCHHQLAVQLSHQ